jgi:uncharacterized protein (DUF983 family)
MASVPPPLPANTWRRLFLTMARALRRRCPYCGYPEIFDGYFALRHSCPQCGVTFEREEGYFLGAYALNLIVALFLGLGLALLLLFRTDLRHLDLIWQEIIALGIAIALPVIFFPYSRLGWIVMDLVFHPPGRHHERQLRGRQAARGDDQRR